MPLESARCAWEVTAGLIPGTPIPEYTKSWWVTSAAWYSPEGPEHYKAAQAKALDYARELMNPRTLNWVRVDWIWF